MKKNKPSYKWKVLCLSCGKPLTGLWCTSNYCEQCCKAGKCPLKDKCSAYPMILEGILKENRKEIIINPSKRVKYV